MKLKNVLFVVAAFTIATFVVGESEAQQIRSQRWNVRQGVIRERAQARRAAMAQQAQERRAAFNSPEARERRRQFWQSFAEGMESTDFDFGSTSYDWGSSYSGSDSNYGLSPSFLRELNNYHSPYNYSGNNYY
ncbi:MAG: hypothetical protein KDA69_04460 [Planctomycetaceae bacterium]|nr:hypothetical protein [Planctomycetaceae bacterium]MCA9043548.1 hypothetical protein [Planctomycetaceae bacterium]